MPQRTDFSSMACSLSRAWSVIGEPWTPLLIRDFALGMTRFDQFQADLGVARNVLADRLRTLLDAGVIEKREYRSANRAREEYVLTSMGRELVPIVMAPFVVGRESSVRALEEALATGDKKIFLSPTVERNCLF